jgi:ABC-2 type transport system permease protein
MTGTPSAVSASRRFHYDSDSRRRREVVELSDLWDYRHLVVEMIIRDIKLRYKRSIIGVAWTMLAPLLNMVALTLIFSALLKQQISNYPVYFMAGSVFWTFFSQGTTYAAAQTSDSNELAKKMFMPRSVFVVSSTGVALVNVFLSLVPMLFLCLVTGFPIRASWLVLPLPILITMAFTLGMGFLIFTLASRFQDIREMYLVLVNTWFFVTPIVYAPSIVPPKFRLVLWLNPLYYLIQTFRDPILKGHLPSLLVTGFSGAIALVMLGVGWLFFCRNIDEFAFRT